MFVYHPISSIFLLRISFLQIFSPYARVFVCVCVGHIPLQSSIFKARYNANINYKYSAVFITHTSRFFTFVWCYSMYAVFFFCCLSSSICCFPFAYFVWCVWWKSVVYIPFQPSFYPPHQICCYFCVLSMNFRSFIRSNSLPTLYHRATIISFYFYLFRKCLSVCVCLYFSEVKRLRIFFFCCSEVAIFNPFAFFSSFSLPSSLICSDLVLGINFLCTILLWHVYPVKCCFSWAERQEQHFSASYLDHIRYSIWQFPVGKLFSLYPPPPPNQLLNSISVVYR